MQTTTLEFGKDKTAIIKGFAIIFMIILHHGGQDWFDVVIPAFSNPFLPHYFSVFKLCVGIFTFMVGYGYAFSANKDFKYSLSHIWKLLLPFWIILFVFTLPIVIAKGEWDWSVFLLNLFGVNSKWCWVSWFVAFYIYAMVVMPFMSCLINKWPVVGAFLLIFLTYGFAVAIHQFVPDYSKNDWTQRLFDCMMNSPTMILGYLFANEKWFNKIHIPQHWSMLFVALLMIVLTFFLRYHYGAFLGFNLDIFYAPLFILAILIIFNLYSFPILSKIFSMLGNTSVYMWFFHSLFFTGVVRSVYQPLILITNNLWLIIPWTILITFCCSWAIQRFVSWMTVSIRQIKKYV